MIARRYRPTIASLSPLPRLQAEMGAASVDVVRLVLKEGASQLMVGSVIGLRMGIGLSRAAQAVLFDAQATDPVILGFVIGVLVAAGLMACIGPAVRATPGGAYRDHPPLENRRVAR